jgi:hypothetical protein
VEPEPGSLAEYFDGWYADMTGTPVKDEIQQRHLGLPPHLLSTSLLGWDGIAEAAARCACSRAARWWTWPAAAAVMAWRSPSAPGPGCGPVAVAERDRNARPPSSLSPNPARLDGVAVRERRAPIVQFCPARLLAALTPAQADLAGDSTFCRLRMAVRGGGPMPGRQVVAARGRFSWASGQRGLCLQVPER